MYKIIIKKVDKVQGTMDQYQQITVLEQTVEDLDFDAVVRAINQLG
ncbi:MAG: hypothetical protein KGI71_06005 [Patescibacteria group bacterium]|nr:hypothetical protein [Patescibacteria group bacterium]